MLKTGICNLSQIKNGVKFKDLFGKEKNLSITLYDQICQESNADELAERILLLFSDERGAYKRTYAKRFEEFDQASLGHIKGYFEEKTSLYIHDAAVSDGRTAVDFFEKTKELFPKLEYLASDFNPKVYVLEKGRLKVTVSHTAKILEVLWPPFVFNTIKRDSWRYYPLNHFIRLAIQYFIVPSLINSYQRGELKAKELMLFAPSALNRARTDQRFILGTHNLLQPFNRQYHIIRAMNVLNISYFTKNEFFQVLRNIHSGLLNDGLFITGSNQDAGSLVNGGVYKKTANGFEQIWQSGTGSPIANYISQFDQ